PGAELRIGGHSLGRRLRLAVPGPACVAGRRARYSQFDHCRSAGGGHVRHLPAPGGTPYPRERRDPRYRRRRAGAGRGGRVPRAAGMYGTYRRMEESRIRENEATLDIGEGGLWLREAGESGAKVVHADYVRQEDGILFLTRVAIFETGTDEQFARRLEADTGQ